MPYRKQISYVELQENGQRIKTAGFARLESLEKEDVLTVLLNGQDILSGKDYTITWKTVITNRFDSAAFKLTHADLFAQFSRRSTSRRFVIA